MTISIALSGCVGGTTPDAAPAGQADGLATTPSAPQASSERVTRLPSHVTSDVVPRQGLPASFPTDLERIPEFEAGPNASAWLAYRPRETLRDGRGWSSETIALWNGSWTKLSLGGLGIPQKLWPGGDMLGPGDLDDTGTRLAFDTTSGVIVVNLTSGLWEPYIEDAGRVGSIRWYPGGSRFVADPWNGRDKVVNVTTGEAADSAIPTLGLGFLGEGDVVTVTRRGDVDRVRNTSGSNIADLPASPRQRGRYFASWWAGNRVAYSNYETVGGRYALRVADIATGQPLAVLTWSRRTGAFLQVHGWLDERRILLSMDRGLVTWAPETGNISRLAELPRSDVRQQHAAVSISFRQPRPNPAP